MRTTGVLREVLPDNLSDLKHVIEWQREQMKSLRSEKAALQAANAELRDVIGAEVERAIEEKAADRRSEKFRVVRRTV